MCANCSVDAIYVHYYVDAMCAHYYVDVMCVHYYYVDVIVFLFVNRCYCVHYCVDVIAFIVIMSMLL